MTLESIKKTIKMYKSHTFKEEKDKTKRLDNLLKGRILILFVAALFVSLLSPYFILIMLYIYCFSFLIKKDLLFPEVISLIIVLLNIVVFALPSEYASLFNLISGYIVLSIFIYLIIYRLVEYKIEKEFEEEMNLHHKTIMDLYKKLFFYKYDSFEDFLNNLEYITEEEIENCYEHFKILSE